MVSGHEAQVFQGLAGEKKVMKVHLRENKDMKEVAVLFPFG